jgi:hypothetical protein
MKNYFEFRSQVQQIVFDPIAKTFATRAVPLGLTVQSGAVDARMLDDVGLDKEAASRGQLELVK